MLLLILKPLLQDVHILYGMMIVENTQNKIQRELSSGSVDKAIIKWKYVSKIFIMSPSIILLITLQKLFLFIIFVFPLVCDNGSSI